MDTFLAQYGITQTDFLNIIAIVVVLVVVLGVLRTIFRWTKTIVRMGCFFIFLVAGILAFLAYLNPI